MGNGQHQQQQLPFEVLNNIFERINRTDIFQCAITCRAWNAAARSMLLRSLKHLSDETMPDFKALLSDNETLQTLQRFVKVATFSKLSKVSDIKLLDTTFPNIETLNVEKCQKKIFMKIYRLISDGGFSRLKEIPKYKCDKAYWDLVSTRRSCIESLFLQDSDGNDPREALENLHVLTQLKSLRILFTAGESLEILVPGSLTLLKELSIVLILSRTPITMKTPHLDVQPLQKLEKVDIMCDDIFVEGDQSYLYFMKKFPNLRILDVQGKIVTTKVSVEVLSEFLVYILNVKWRTRVESFKINQHTPDVIYDFLTKVFYRQDSQQYRNKSKVNFRLNLTFNRSQMTLFEDTTSQNVNGKFLIMSDCEFGTKTCDLIAFYKLGQEDIITKFQPCKELLQRIEPLNVVKNLTLRGCASFHDKKSLTMTVLLDEILEDAPHLDFLEISGLLDVSRSEVPHDFMAPNLQVLQLSECIINQKIFQLLDQKCPNLKLLEMHQCRIIDGHIYPNDVLQIDLPSTNLDELIISIPNKKPSRIEYVFIKLETATQEPRYCKTKWKEYYDYKLNHYTAIDQSKSRYTEEDYKTHILDDKCHVFSIRCESVTKFVLRTSFYMSCKNHIKNVVIT